MEWVLRLIFSSPCLEAGPTIRYKSFHTVDTRFTEQAPRYSDYYGQFAWFLKKESHYIFSKFHPLNTDILYGQFSVRINVTAVTNLSYLPFSPFQEDHYPQWSPALRRFWRRGRNRVYAFWFVSFSMSAVVATAITTDYLNWDEISRDFMPTNELSRAFLASFILVMDLFIVMQV